MLMIWVLFACTLPHSEEYKLRGININNLKGKRHISEFIGSNHECEKWLTPKVEQWVVATKNLQKSQKVDTSTGWYTPEWPSASQPNGSTYSVLCQELHHFLSQSRKYPARREDFLPALLDVMADDILVEMRTLLAQSVRNGRIGIRRPTATESAPAMFNTSMAACL